MMKLVTSIDRFSTQDVDVCRLSMVPFEANARTFRWSERECMQNLLNALRGDAQNIMALLDDDVVTYARLFAAL